MNVHNHKRRSIKTYRLIVIILSTVLVLAVLSFLLRGIWRSNILPAYVSSRHKGQLEITLNNEAANVNKSLQSLGIKLDERTTPASCILDIAREWRTSIYCSDEVDSSPKSFSLFPTGSDISVQQVEKSMLGYGWRGGLDSSGFELLYYNKDVSGFSCTVQLLNGTSDKTITGRLFCSHTYHYLGDPYSAL
jgi:hypothetical protein